MDDWHLEQADALRRLTADLGRPVTVAELACALRVSPRDVTNTALVKRGYALIRREPLSGSKGLWPRQLGDTRLRAAWLAFRAIPDGTILTWTEPRRDSKKAYIRRRLTVTAALKERLRKALGRACQKLGIRGLSRVEGHHLRMMLDAVWAGQMERSHVPEEHWHSSEDVVRRARKTADNRRSEVRTFLSWAESESFLTLNVLATDTLSPDWIDFVLRAGEDSRLMTNLRRIGKLAMALGAASPVRLVEVGFHRITATVMQSGKDHGSAKVLISRYRRAWNRVASAPGLPPLPQWTSTSRSLKGWFNAGAFVSGRPSILDEAGMEFHRRQARDLCDWWTAPDPSTCTGSSGQLLGPRPKTSRHGRKRMGARSRREPTPIRHLYAVSLLCRFVLEHDAPECRMTADELRRTDWRDLFADLDRLRRFIEWVITSNYLTSGGTITDEDEWTGGTLTAGVKVVWSVYTMLWAYFPAVEKAGLAAASRALVEIAEFANPGDFNRGEELRRARLMHEARIARWEEHADAIKAHILRLLALGGGIIELKPKKEIRRLLHHGNIRRIVDALRAERLTRLSVLRKKTAALQRQRRRLREVPCLNCATLACETHNPDPALSPAGVAWELVSESYVMLIIREAMLRLLSILPWRPGVFRKARLGVHVDPDSLQVRARGHDLKVEHDATGNVRWQMVSLPDLEYWDDPEEVERAIEALRALLAEARPWCEARKGRFRGRTPDATERPAEYLFLNSRGLPWATPGTFSTAFRTAIEFGAHLVNKAGPDHPIILPDGWGARSSYILRFLWGDRARRHGASFEEIAAVLGNSPRTVARYYHDEERLEAQNRVTRDRRNGHTANARDLSSEGDLVLELEALRARIYALPLADDVRAHLFQREAARLINGARGAAPSFG
jgi:hypothetical protein